MEAQNELDAIQSEIRQLEKSISHPRLFLLLQRLNSLQSSTRNLPSETLSLIFQYACPPTAYFIPESYTYRFTEQVGPFSAFTLAQVSSLWRQVVWFTPQLWAGPTYQLKPDNAHIFPHVLKLHLQNAKGVPFNLGLIWKFPTHPTRIITETVQSIEALLYEYSANIRALLLPFVPQKCLALTSAKLPLLKCFILAGDVRQEHNLFLEHCPLLHHVYLEHVYGEITLPWSSVTRLDLSDIPMETCAKLLTHCPNLIEFHAADPPKAYDLDEPPPIWFPSSAVTLHQLRTFSWPYHRSQWCLAPLRRIQVPALEWFRWSEGDATFWWIEDTCLDVFKRIPHTLHDLQIVNIDWGLRRFKLVFAQFRSLQSLAVVAYQKETVYGLLCALSPGWGGDETLYLPRLNSLRISHYKGQYEPQQAPEPLDINCSYRILEIFKSRGDGSKIRIEIRGFQVVWAASVEKEGALLVADSKL